jgi:hypothetical protein
MYTMSRAVGVYRRDLILPKGVMKKSKSRRTNWKKLREIADETGALPPVPSIKDRRSLLNDVHRYAMTGNIFALAEMRIDTYNSAVKTIGRYRDVCFAALLARQRNLVALS